MQPSSDARPDPAPASRSWTPEELLRGLKAGEADAWRQVIDRYSAHVRWAIRKTGLRGVEQMDDVFQETFVQAVSKVADINSVSSLGGWLCQVATHKAIDLMRRRATELKRLKDLYAMPPNDADPQPQSTDYLDILLEEVDGLDEKYRIVIKLHHLDGMDCVDVARTLHVPLGTVHAQLKRGREQLRVRLLRRKARGDDETVGAGFLLLALDPPSKDLIARTVEKVLAAVPPPPPGGTKDGSPQAGGWASNWLRIIMVAALGGCLLCLTGAEKPEEARPTHEAGESSGSEVVRVEDENTLIVREGGQERRVRLAGIAGVSAAGYSRIGGNEDPARIQIRKAMEAYLHRELCGRRVVIRALPAASKLDELARQDDPLSPKPPAVPLVMMEQGGRSVNLEMVRSGYAYVDTGIPLPQLQKFKEAFRKAREEQKGLFKIP